MTTPPFHHHLLRRDNATGTIVMWDGRYEPVPWIVLWAPTPDGWARRTKDQVATWPYLNQAHYPDAVVRDKLEQAKRHRKWLQRENGRLAHLIGDLRGSLARERERRKALEGTVQYAVEEPAADPTVEMHCPVCSTRIRSRLDDQKVIKELRAQGWADPDDASQNRAIHALVSHYVEGDDEFIATFVDAADAERVKTAMATTASDRVDIQTVTLYPKGSDAFRLRPRHIAQVDIHGDVYRHVTDWCADAYDDKDGWSVSEQSIGAGNARARNEWIRITACCPTRDDARKAAEMRAHELGAVLRVEPPIPLPTCYTMDNGTRVHMKSRCTCRRDGR